MSRLGAKSLKHRGSTEGPGVSQTVGMGLAFPARETMRERLTIIGNGLAGTRALEELLTAAPGRYDIRVFGAERFAESAPDGRTGAGALVNVPLSLPLCREARGGCMHG